MKRLVLLNRTRIFRVSSVSPLSTQTRSLKPLYKLVHPDLFGQESEVVRNSNLACMQNLTELFDALSFLESKMSSKTSELTIQNPLNKKYSLTCYIFDPDSMVNEQTNKRDLVHISYTLTPPSVLCSKNTISHRELSDSIYSLKHFVSQFFALLRLQSPWTASAAAAPRSKPNEHNSYSDPETQIFYEAGLGVDTTNASQSDVDRHVYESLLRQQHRLSGWNAFGGDLKHQKQFSAQLTRSVDNFIQRGNVFVHGLAPSDEFTAVQRLRSFLVQYGDVVNFSGHKDWDKVVFIIGKASKSSKQRRAPKLTASMESDLGYACEVRLGRNIIDIPSNFRRSHLLDFIHKFISISHLK